MTTYADASDVQIAFPKVVGGANLPIPAHAGPDKIDQGLGQMVATEGPAQARRSLICKDLLLRDTRVQAEIDARRLYVEMKGNSQVFMTYGTDALADVNALNDRLLKEIGPVNIPELTELMKELSDDMRAVKRKYDPSDSKVRERYEKFGGGFIRRLFGGARSMVEMLMEDVTTIEKQIDKIGGELNGRKADIVRNVSYYDELYDQNEVEIGKLIYVIAVMELIFDLAVAEASAIEVGDASLGDRRGEQKAGLAEFANNMEVKIGEYKGRLFIAWATSPQVRMMRTLNVGLATRINELVNVAIPTMKSTIVQWRLLMQSKDANDMAKLVMDSTNEWLQAYARAGAEAVPAIAEAVQTPTLTPQTVSAMANSILAQSDGIIKAMEIGDQRRRDLDAAILEAHGAMAGSSEKVSDALVERAVRAATTSQLEIAKSVD